jgi:hypothetical protein
MPPEPLHDQGRDEADDDYRGEQRSHEQRFAFVMTAALHFGGAFP